MVRLAEALAVLKPEYRVPSMDEVRAVPPNGLRVASTFSGCGGSSLGFRMAGFTVLYANEFIEAARESYRANASETTFIDSRDIRTVSGSSLRELAGLGDDELDVLEGSPPCASFSTAGKRHRLWGEVKSYSDTRQRADDLFFEYARLVGEVRPRAFVAENVSGLAEGVAKGYFIEILAALRKQGYRVGVRKLDAQWLGVPQRRKRLIFIGFREDLGLDPADAFPAPLAYRYSLRDAVPWIEAVEGATGYDKHAYRSSDLPAETVLAGRPVRVIASDLVETGVPLGDSPVGREWAKLLPGETSKKYLNLVKADANRPSPTVTALGGRSGGTASVAHPTEPRKYSIPELRLISGFPADFELSGTYAQQWERIGRAVPPPMMAAVARGVADVLLRRDLLEKEEKE